MILIYIDEKKKNFIDITCAFLMKSETFLIFEKKEVFLTIFYVLTFPRIIKLHLIRWGSK